MSNLLPRRRIPPIILTVWKTIWPPPIRTNSMFLPPPGSKRPSHHLARPKKGLKKEKSCPKFFAIPPKGRLIF